MSLERGPGKPIDEMLQFFQRRISRGDLKAYLVEVDPKEVLKDTPEEEVVRTKKGTVLTPVERLEERDSFILEDPKTGTYYVLETSSSGDAYVDGGGQASHHNCILERLTQFDPDQVNGIKDSFGRVSIDYPEEVIGARLSVSYDRSSDHSGSGPSKMCGDGTLSIEGEQDRLFKKVAEFVRSS